MGGLTRSAADALCTAVAIGFIHRSSEGPRSRATSFEYEEDTLPERHATVRAALHDIGVELTLTRSVAQSEMPWIIARTPRFPDRERARIELQGETPVVDYLRSISRRASALTTAPPGAYIGGLSSTSTLRVLGPSKVDLYEPRFRTVDEVDAKEIELAYANAVDASRDAWACLDPVAVARPRGVTVFVDRPEETASTWSDGQVVRSVHGMVRAMVEHQTSIDRQEFVFEIALGRGTPKVSSCLPCSVFMTASGMPATSTHLGRGDNWGVPESAHARREWRGVVNSCYSTGRSLGGRNGRLNTLLAAVDPQLTSENRFPDVFLECLTFEGPFTSKVISSMA